MPPKKVPYNKLSKSGKYFRDHPKARKNKDRNSKAVNERPEQIRKRVESNKKRREAKRKGINVNGKDYDHASNRLISSKANRGKKGEGGRRRGVKKKRSR